MKYGLSCACLLFPVVAGLLNAQEERPRFNLQRGLVYGKGGDTEMKLDLAVPDGAGPFPAVVCLHGGGWRSGDRNQVARMAQELVRRGYVVAAVSYRLVPSATFPAQIEDCKAAVRWLRANAEKYKIDPNHIGAAGVSAGGHLACLLGLTRKEDGLEGTGGNADQSSQVQAVASIFGPTDLADPHFAAQVKKDVLAPLVGGSVEEKPEAYKKASPVTYARSGAPPFLFLHGTADQTVPIQQSRTLADKLRAAGGSAKVIEYEGQGHNLQGPAIGKALQQVVAFFDETLKQQAPAQPATDKPSAPQSPEPPAPTGAEVHVNYPRGSWAMWDDHEPLSPVLARSRGLVGIALNISWKTSQPGPEQFNWSVADARIREARQAGLYVALAFVTSPLNAPDWLKNDRRVHSIRLVDTFQYHRYLGTYGKEVPYPLFWDPVFHESKKAYIREAGRHYAQTPGIVAVTCSFANLFTHDYEVPHEKRRLPAEAGGGVEDQIQKWLAAGYSTDKMLRVAHEIIDTTAEAFPTQALKLPISGMTHPQLDGTGSHLIEQVLAYAYRRYAGRFYAQFNALNATVPAANNSRIDAANPNQYGVLFRLLKRYSPQIGLQMAAAATNGPKDGYRLNGRQGGLSPDRVLQRVVETGLTYKPVFIEYWRGDSINPALERVVFQATRSMGGTAR